MPSGPDLDPYRPTPPVDGRTIARRVARTLGVLGGLGLVFVGIALYALRCFDTCPTDPAQDKVGQALTVSVILAGIAVAVAAVSAGSRWSRGGWSVVAGLGATILLCGIAAVALAPAIDAPGDHSGSTRFGIVAILVGGLGAGGAWVRRRVGS